MPGTHARTVGRVGETRLIGYIRSWLGAASPPAPRGIGDDCAVLPPPRRKHRQLVTVDPVIRGRHFDDRVSPAAVAAKLFRRNLSDIAAMGGVPRWVVVALAASPDTELAWLRRFFRALSRESTRWHVPVVGGDCTQTGEPGPGLGVWITALGEAPRRPLTRRGARAGDLLFVSGTLGGSGLGHHVRFTPRLEEGRWLAGRPDVRSAIDLSDGLAKDVRALLSPDAAVRIDPGHVPVSTAARRLARRTGRPALEHACNDGEDYELLFAVAPGRVESFVVAWHRRFTTRLSCIGRLEPRRRGAPVVHFAPEPDVPIDLRGYEHFR